MPIEQFRELVSKSKSITDIVRYFGFAITGKAFRMIKERIKVDNIDCSHISMGLNNRLGKKYTIGSVPLENVMIENSSYHYGHLKKRLLANGLLRNECYICGQKPLWNEQKLVMIMDHVNGERNDHRMENLRMLCPNCNSQTKTFSGRNYNPEAKTCRYCGAKTARTTRCKSCYSKMKVRKTDNKCIDCGKVITSVSKRCSQCNHDYNGFVKNKPDKEDLKEMINTMTWVDIGKKYGVSDNAIRRWAKKYELIK